MGSERRVLAKLVARYVGEARGIFELADGHRVELEGALPFDSTDMPEPGDKALVILDADDTPMRWEPYLSGPLRRTLD
jgi:hypothetical protein